MRYTHLTQDERYLIQQYKIDGLSRRAIARQLGRSASTISRELERNRGVHGWRPILAQKKALARQQSSRNARRVDEASWQEVAIYLRMNLSPEQAIHRLALERGCPTGISHETVYQRIYADKRTGGGLIGYLRGQKPRRKRSGQPLPAPRGHPWSDWYRTSSRHRRAAHPYGRLGRRHHHR